MGGESDVALEPDSLRSRIDLTFCNLMRLKNVSANSIGGPHPICLGILNINFDVLG